MRRALAAATLSLWLSLAGVARADVPPWPPEPPPPPPAASPFEQGQAVGRAIGFACGLACCFAVPVIAGIALVIVSRRKKQS